MRTHPSTGEGPTWNNARVPALQRLARRIGGEPRAALTQLLVLACEQMDMDVAFVSTVTPAGDHLVRLAVRGDGRPMTTAEWPREPLAQTWCGLVADRGLLLVGDAADHPEPAATECASALRIES